MGKIFIIGFFIVYWNISSAQIDGTLLLGLTQATTTEMNAVSNPVTGSLIYNTSESKVYQYNGSTWDKLITSPLKILPKTTNYTLTNNDNGGILTFDNNSDLTLTIPSGLPIGFNVSVYQIGDGKVILQGANGVTLKNRLSRFKTAGKDAGAGIVCTSTNIFHATGDLKK